MVGVTSDELARLFDCSKRQIEMLADRGVVIRVKRGRYNAAVSTRNYIRHLRAQAAGRTEQPDTGTIDANAATLIRNVLRDEGAPSEGPMQPSMARNAETILKARARYLKVETESGRLIDRPAAAKQFFECARQLRDAWLAWPQRVATLMAAALGVDERRLAETLSRHVHEHLVELGEPAAPFAD